MRVQERNRLQQPLQSMENGITVFRSLPSKLIPPIQKLNQCYRYRFCKTEMQNKKFSNCDHLGTCVHCAQNYMLNSIKKNEYPQCFLDPRCQAKMITSPESVFDYFSITAKDKWKSFQKEIKDSKLRPKIKPIKRCIMQECPGVIIYNRCTKCSIFYCEKCRKTDHAPNEQCCGQSTESGEWPRQKQCIKCQSKRVKQLNEFLLVYVCQQESCGCRFCWPCRKQLGKQGYHLFCRKGVRHDCCNIF